MSRLTIQATAEELFCDDLSACAELSVEFEMTPPEKATRDYPGDPGMVELLEWEVDEITVHYDDYFSVLFHNRNKYGKDIRPSAWSRFIPVISKWVDENEDRLIESAIEKEAEMEEDWRY